jgi:four helix bundle protein
MKDFRDLKVWHKAHQLALATYRGTADFPSEERYGLTSQLRRGAVSIASNIAEGCGRATDPDFARCLSIAAGSASEVEYQLLLSFDLNLLDEAHYRDLSTRVTEVKRMITSLIQALKADR